jgi:hypothetical protein
MKLKVIHLFLILLGVLIISYSLGGIVEGFSESETKEKRENHEKEIKKETKKDFNKLMSGYKEYNTFNGTKHHNKKHTDDNSDIYDYGNKMSNDTNADINNSNYYIGPSGDTVLTGPSSGSTYHKKNNSNKLSDYTPLGITRSQIPSGDEHLYILKSEVIPPVCPACPSIIACPIKTKDTPPPCPPCARCPEPAFDCKKVPNYNRDNNQYLPIPVLSDFSQFGM